MAGRRLYTEQVSCQGHMFDSVFVVLLRHTNNEQGWPHMPVSRSPPNFPPAWFVHRHGIPFARLAYTNRLARLA